MTLPPRTVGALLCLLVCFVLHGPSASAQPAQLSEQSRISLITMLPGDPVHSFAGHSALRVKDPVHDLDRIYNYGTFNFGDPLFIPKFLYGHLRYYLSISPTGPMLRIYEQQGRPVIEQPLNLGPTQRTAVYRFLQTNAQPENRYYQYDFFFDNCSTRIRDVLQQTLGNSVDFSKVTPPDRSFRKMLDPYVASRPFLDLGFDLALGLPADQRPSSLDGMFLPIPLMEAFEQATVTRNGTQQPLVTRTDTIRHVGDYNGMTAGFDWPLALSIGFLLLVLGWTSLQVVRRDRPGGLGDALLLVLVGCIGLGACFLWFVSTYHVTNDNLNLLWAWPTHLGAAYVLLRRPSSNGLRLYLQITAGAALLFVLGWPFWPQNFHLSVLPLVAGLGIRAGWWGLLLHGTKTPFSSQSPSSTMASPTST